MNNKEKFPIGSIAYYVKKRGYKWSAWFGIVTEHYADCVELELYDLPETRRIGGVKYDDFVTPTHWAKLPKGWSYDTDLVNLSFDEYPSGTNLYINKSEDIVRAINEGLLVEVAERDYSTIEAEIDKTYGYKLVRKPSQDYHPSCISVDWDKLYKTYDEAQAVIAAYKVELARQAELSDYDWSVEQMDRVLARWQMFYGASNKEKNKYREWLLDLEHFEDVEVRLFEKNIQWRYWKNKYGKTTKWHNIEF